MPRIPIGEMSTSLHESQNIYRFAPRSRSRLVVVQPSRRRPLGVYTVLNVPFGASNRVVENSFRKLALQFHPDKHSSLSAAQKTAMTKKFQEIVGARDLLLDKDARQAYDAQHFRDLARETPSFSYKSTARVRLHRSFLSRKEKQRVNAIDSCRARCAVGRNARMRCRSRATFKEYRRAHVNNRHTTKGFAVLKRSKVRRSEDKRLGPFLALTREEYGSYTFNV